MSVRWWPGFAALCVLSGSGWLLDEWRPRELSGAGSLFVDHVLMAVLFAALSWWLGDWPAGRRDWLRLLSLGGWGVLLIAVPALLIAGGAISSTTSALLLLGMPAVVVFVEAQNEGSFGSERNWLSLLVPALAGLLGAALILPFAWPAEGMSQLRLGLLVVSVCAAGWAVVRMHRAMAGSGDAMAKMALLPSLAAISGAVALVALPAAMRGQSWGGSAVRVEVLRCVYELPVFFLMGWLLREMRPAAFAGRVFLILVVTLLESYVLLRPEVVWTMGLGMALLLLGGAGLLRADSPDVL